MNWRPIRTAPKDELILLQYPSFTDQGDSVVCVGRWIEYPSYRMASDAISKGMVPDPSKYNRGWIICYPALYSHSRWRDGHSWEIKTIVVEATHWQPLPKAPVTNITGGKRGNKK